MRIEGTNKDGEAVAREIAGFTEKDEAAIKSVFGKVRKFLCRTPGCLNSREFGSSRCKQCSDKHNGK